MIHILIDTKKGLVDFFIAVMGHEDGLDLSKYLMCFIGYAFKR